MIFKEWHKWLMVFLVALAPIITLLGRGIVWGSDSFAFWTVSCGKNEFAHLLGSPDWFIWFLQNAINCNLYHLAFIEFFLYLFALLGVWVIGKHIFGKEGWRLPIYFGALTPLIFIEVLRFENDFFGWALALIALGLFVWILDKQKVYNMC